MFDWSGLVGQAKEMFNGGAIGDIANGELSEQLSTLGIDASALNGLQVEQLQTLFDDAGIDLAKTSAASSAMTTIASAPSCDASQTKRYFL